jgi:hypothetical protein
MKKLVLASVSLALILAPGCGDPSSPTGSLPQVTGLEVVDSLCSGTQVSLRWNSVPDVDGYRLYWSETTGSWDELVNVVDTTYIDDVSTRSNGGAGYYTVLAFNGVDTSEDYSEYAHTHPSFCGSYTIWSNHAPADSLDAIIFGETSGSLGKASDPAFLQDAYCFDGGWAQSPVGLNSGDLAPFGDGSHVDMAKGNNPRIAPDSGYVDSIHLIDGDRLFIELSSGNFVKMNVTGIPADTIAPDSIVYGLEINYWYQPIPRLRIFSNL